MLPGQHDFTVVRGTQGPTQGLVFRLKARDGDTLVNIPYEDVRLSVYRRKNLLFRAALSDGGLIVSNEMEAEITWSATSEQTRLVPLGPKATYEVEVWNAGSEVVYLMGTLTGLGGINDDEDDEELS